MFHGICRRVEALADGCSIGEVGVCLSLVEGVEARFSHLIGS